MFDEERSLITKYMPFLYFCWWLDINENIYKCKTNRFLFSWPVVGSSWTLSGGKWFLQALGAFHSTKISGWLSEIFIRRMERYFPLRRTDLVPLPLKHILLDKMLKDHGKVAVSSAVSCFLEINLTHTKFFLNIYLTDSNTIFAWWEQLANFSRGKVCRGSMQTERIKPQEIRNDQFTIFQKRITNRLELWHIILHPV